MRAVLDAMAAAGGGQIVISPFASSESRTVRDSPMDTRKCIRASRTIFRWTCVLPWTRSDGWHDRRRPFLWPPRHDLRRVRVVRVRPATCRWFTRPDSRWPKALDTVRRTPLVCSLVTSRPTRSSGGWRTCTAGPSRERYNGSANGSTTIQAVAVSPMSCSSTRTRPWKNSYLSHRIWSESVIAG